MKLMARAKAHYLELVRAGMKKGVLKRSGSRGNYRYTLNGRPITLEASDKLIAQIETGAINAGLTA